MMKKIFIYALLMLPLNSIAADSDVHIIKNCNHLIFYNELTMEYYQRHKQEQCEALLDISNLAMRSAITAIKIHAKNNYIIEELQKSKAPLIKAYNNCKLKTRNNHALEKLNHILHEVHHRRNR